jgi:DNA sulfur modification protein DndD
MLIEKVILNNFRVYKGINELDLSVDTESNVSIISGNNGFGKTSLLTSLVWCLYGKLMGEVDERYRKEIYESGGYKRFCEKTMNRAAIAEGKRSITQPQLAFDEPVEQAQPGHGSDAKSADQFSVSVFFTQLLIPSIACQKVQITRTYTLHNHQEAVEILIDGSINELTREVGHEIFIHDFILPKEIAKFFFFDAEKIVSLAEIRSTEEKRVLSQAYGEVLGIKKYNDLKENLQNMRLRLRKKSAKSADSDRLEKVKKHLEQNGKLISHGDERIKEKGEELAIKKAASEKLQERLIREGMAITVEELMEFRQMRDQFTAEGARLKNKLKDFMELAPFAIAANKLGAAIQQLENERGASDQQQTASLLQNKLKAIKRALKKNQEKLALTAKKEEQLLEIIGQTLLPDHKVQFKPLLNFSTEQQNEFVAIYENVQNAYTKNFRQLIAELKMQQSSYLSVSRKLQDSESKQVDPVIKAIRNDKIQLDTEIKTLENELLELKSKRHSLETENESLKRQESELTRKVGVEKLDTAKDEIAARLIGGLDIFINRLKVKKKASLEKNILQELNRLMHKSSFVSKVEVIIEGELIDIELYDSNDDIINKDGLSKGEQQLYATALLKALVDESNIRFPVFIDSPLQKFDQEHARNIIVDFYPNISSQVVIFPLLEKELNEKEYQWLLPRIGKTYLIQQVSQYQSQFKSVQPEKLFKTYRNHKEHVYQH